MEAAATHAVHNAEDGCGGTDAKREVYPARSGETGAAAEHPGGVAEVANKIFDATRAARVPAFFLESLDAAKIDQGRSAAPRPAACRPRCHLRTSHSRW